MTQSNELLDRLTAWSYRRQLLDQRRADAYEALEHVIAVYSSHPTAPLSLLARSASLDADEFQRLEQEHLAVRLPAMRGSIFLIPIETAPQVFAATRVPIEKQAGRLKYAELTWDDYARIKEQVAEIATTPMSTTELQEAIPVSGNLMVAVKTLSREGLVVRVGEGLRSDNLRYVSTAAWLGKPLDERNPDESLVWLASAYLNAYGPARIADFAWWAGVTKTRAKRAMNELSTVDVGDDLLILEEDYEPFQQQEPIDPNLIALIPKWDAYTMAHAMDGRARFVDDEHLPLAYAKVSATSGDGLPLVLRGGKAIATWGHRFQGDKMTVTVSPFDSGDDAKWLPQSCFEPVATLLGATDFEVVINRES